MTSGKKEVLYNGIELPTEWPPDYGAWADNPMPLPYLDNPPEVIPIDVGRQLLVDDFLVQDSTLKRVFHLAEYYEANPILRPDRPWEGVPEETDMPPADLRPMAMPFSDGVWYDPKDGTFKMWYMAGGPDGGTAYATSKDAIHWEKPSLDVVPGTNLVSTAFRDSTTVWLDLEATDPNKRFIFTRARHGSVRGDWRVDVHYSPDGIHWTDPVFESGPTGDRTTIFWNPFRKVWVCSARGDERTEKYIGDHFFRLRLYKESPDLFEALRWDTPPERLGVGEHKPGEPVVWVTADRLDAHHPHPQYSDIHPQLYNLDGQAYESLFLGMFSVWQGPNNPEQNRMNLQKRNQVMLGFSRDGFHWDRPDRRAFLPADIDNPDAWNRGNVQSVQACLVMGDKLYLYCSGRAYGKPGDANTTGLAMLRRDGFASLEAGAEGGVLTTRPVTFTGQYLFVNVDVEGGELLVEVLDKDGRAIPGLTREQCLPVMNVNSTLQQVVWQGGKDLAALVGKPVRFRFYLHHGGLYAFWVSPDSSGASYGYVGTGGPGFNRPVDDAGLETY